MSDSRKKMMASIEAKAKRKQDLRDDIALRNENVEALVLRMINDLEDMAIRVGTTGLFISLSELYSASFECQIQTIDPGSSVEVKWIDSGGIMHVNGILIKWSKEYQRKHSCEEQLFIDPASLLLK